MLFFVCFLMQTIDQNALDDALQAVRCTYDQQVVTQPVMGRDSIHAGALQQYMAYLSYSEYGRGDIVVGDEQAETLYVTGSFYNNGNIVVINDGVVLINNADFYLDGNIIVMDHGYVSVDSSRFTILEHFIYHHNLSIGDSSFFSITNTTTSFNGYQVNLTVLGFGQFVMDNVVNEDWITAVVMHDASAAINDVDLMGEWLFIDRCSATFNHVDYLITWYFCQDSSIIDFTFPAGDTVYDFIFDSSLVNITHVDYHVEIDSSTGCLWAMIPLRGSDVTIRDSDLRVTGLMFEGVDSFTVTGLVNGLHYNDFTLPIQDRTYHLVNTTIQTWNLYPTDTSNVTLSSSIFGELCGFSNSNTTIQQAFCDGSGGHIEASGTATVLVLVSSIFADVITKDYGICVIGQCSMPYGRIWATGSSILLIVNTQFPEDPLPSDTAVVFVIALTAPSEAMVDDTVGIIGSAWIDPGPYNPLMFDHYHLYYRVIGDSTWLSMGNSHSHEVRRDTLEYWNTVGLAPGDYEVRLVLKDNAGDSVDAMKHIRLRPLAIAEKNIVENVPVLCYDRIRSNVFSISSKASVPDICIYDVTGQLVNEYSEHKVSWHAPASGVFFIKERSCGRTYKIIAF